MATEPKKYLDFNGLKTLITNIKNTFLTQEEAKSTYLADVDIINTGDFVTKTSSGSPATVSLNFNPLTTKLNNIDNAISGLSNAVHFVGVTTTELTDKSTTKTIKINNADYTASKGDVVIYNTSSKEFVFDGTNWHELGDISAERTDIDKLSKVVYGDGGSATVFKAGGIAYDFDARLDTLEDWVSNNGHTALPAMGTDVSVQGAWDVVMNPKS